MKTTTTSFGKFTITGYTSTLNVQINRTGNETPSELVEMAIMFANHYKCTISRRVEYASREGVTFQVKCDSNTSRFIYEYGKIAIGNASVSGKDLMEYNELFGTTKCIHKGFEKKFWYCDNFHGDTHTFNTLEVAVESASKEYGNIIYIYTNVEMQAHSRLECKVKASGNCLP